MTRIQPPAGRMAAALSLALLAGCAPAPGTRADSTPDIGLRLGTLAFEPCSLGSQMPGIGPLEAHCTTFEVPEDRSRPDVPPMLRKLAAWSWRLLVVLAAVGLLLYLLIQLKVIVVPVIVALFLATLLVPLVHARS